MRDGVQAAAVHTRMCSPARAGNGATILRYRSIADGPLRRFIDPAWRLSPSTFERHCAWLATHRTVVSLSNLVETLRSGGRPEPGTVVITFDAGYRDSLDIAAPILARFELPATLFLASDYVEEVAPHWGDRLYTTFRMRRHQEFELHGRCFDLNRQGEALAAYRALSAELCQVGLRVREAWLDETERRLAAAVRMPRLTLDWDDVQTLGSTHPSFEIAAHGAGHLDLSSQPEDVVRDDLARCLSAIEQRTGRAARHFAFPYGRSSELARRVVIDMGLASAAAALSQDPVDETTDLYDMGRMDARVPLYQLAFWSAGGWNALPRLRKEVA